MNRLPFILIVSFLFGNIHAQSKAGITGIPDTSFNVNTAFANTKKDYPYATVVSEIQSKSVKEQRNIVYCEIDGRKLLLDAFYPSKKNSKKRIAILIIHGGGWRSGNRSLHYPLAQRLAALGYVCFTPEYRLSTEALYPAAVYDIKSAIQWIRKNARKFNVDTNKVVAMGHSAGGELAAFMGASNDAVLMGYSGSKGFSAKVNAVVDIDGIVAFIHPESGEGDDSKRTSSATYWFGYSKTENPSIWEQASPLSHVNAHAVPILFLNSSVARMHAGRDDYIKVLQQNNIYSEVKTYPNTPHSFCLFEPWFMPMVEDITSFLTRVFKN